MSRDVLFFDLDGTLIDSAVGITRCVAYALERMQQPVPPLLQGQQLQPPVQPQQVPRPLP